LNGSQNSLFPSLVPMLVLLACGFTWIFIPVELNYPWHGRYPFSEPDSLLYLRWLEQSILQGKALVTDWYASFPEPFQLRFPPLYFQLLMTAVHLFFSLFPATSVQAESVAGMVPPVLWLGINILTIGFLWRRAENRTIPLLGGLFLFPGLSAAMTFDFMHIDHHCMEAFLLWLWIFGAERHAEEGGTATQILGGCASALFILTWMGSPLFFAFVTAYAVLLILRNDPLAPAVSEYAASSMLIGGGLAAIWTIRSQGFSGPMAVNEFGILQASLAFLAGAFIQFVSYVRIREWFQRRWLVIGAIAAIGVFALAFPRIIQDGIGFLLKTNPIIGTISELVPMLDASKPNELTQSYTRIFTAFGCLFFLLPMVKVVGSAGVFDRAGRIVLHWISFIILLSLFQYRFLRWLGPGFGIAAAVLLWGLIRVARERRAKPIHVACFVLPIMFVSVSTSYGVMGGLRHMIPKSLEAVNWLAEHSPETTGYKDDIPPEYGVLSFWDQGNLITYYGRRPTTVGNTLRGVRRMAEVFTSGTEDEAYRLCTGYRVKYILLERPEYDERTNRAFFEMRFQNADTPSLELSGGQSRSDVKVTPFAETFYSYLYAGYGLMETGRFAKSAEHFRIIFSTLQQRRELPCYVFEVVAGAHLEGISDPHSVVRVVLNLEIGGDRALYRSRALADAWGCFQVRVPYVTGNRKGRVKTGSAYEVMIHHHGELKILRFAVSDRDVLTGAVVSTEISGLAE